MTDPICMSFALILAWYDRFEKNYHSCVKKNHITGSTQYLAKK